MCICADEKADRKVLYITISFQPFPKQDLVLHVWSTGLWENEKLLVTAISPVPTVFSTLLENSPTFSLKLTLLSANSSCLEGSKGYCFEMNKLNILQTIVALYRYLVLTVHVS